jgi:hypothetical protein
MTILRNFDLDSIRKERARRAAAGGVNLVDAINQISPDIGKLKVGETAKLPIPNGMALRKFVMSITAKLNNLTVKGADWEGHTYRTVSDGESHVYVQRGPDAKAADIRVPNRRGGGGRGRKASGTAPASGAAPSTGQAESGATVTAH